MRVLAAFGVFFAKFCRIKIFKMTKPADLSESLQYSILGQSTSFLLRLHAGAPDDMLIDLLIRIRKDEMELMRREKLQLHPKLWNILFCHYVNRRVSDIIYYWN